MAEHIYINIAHVYSSTREYIDGITSLAADDELVILTVMHFQLEYEAICAFLGNFQSGLQGHGKL